VVNPIRFGDMARQSIVGFATTKAREDGFEIDVGLFLQLVN
jgi:hypothetical protein